MAIKKISWRIVLSGESYVDLNEECDPSHTECCACTRIYQEAADRLGDIIGHEGLPEWTDMETKITSVGKAEADDHEEECKARELIELAHAKEVYGG